LYSARAVVCRSNPKHNKFHTRERFQRSMRYFECPKCNAKVHAIATDVTHRCPSNKSKFTPFVEVKKEPKK